MGHSRQNAECHNADTHNDRTQTDLPTEGQPVCFRYPGSVVRMNGRNIPTHIGNAENDADDSGNKGDEKTGHRITSAPM